MSQGAELHDISQEAKDTTEVADNSVSPASNGLKKPDLNGIQKEEKTGNVWAKLRDLAGTYDGPTDWSVEHDHYLYGIPKKEKKRKSTNK